MTRRSTSSHRWRWEPTDSLLPPALHQSGRRIIGTCGTCGLVALKPLWGERLRRVSAKPDGTLVYVEPPCLEVAK